MDADTESGSCQSPWAQPVACSGGFREARGARGPNRHDVFSLRHRSQLTCPTFVTHRSFCEWQRLQAERIFPGGLLDSPPEETPDAEAEAAGGVVKRSMLRTRLERNGWRKMMERLKETGRCNYRALNAKVRYTSSVRGS